MATCGSLLINWKFLQQGPCLGNRCQGYKRKLFYNLDFHSSTNSVIHFTVSGPCSLLLFCILKIFAYKSISLSFMTNMHRSFFFSFCGIFVNISMVIFKFSRSLLFLSFLCLQITTKHFEGNMLQSSGTEFLLLQVPRTVYILNT